MKVTPATYLSEFMLIKLNASIPAFCHPEQPRGFRTAQEVGIFMHEWMHYLHNTYTLLGLVTFNHTIGLWKTFRWSYDRQGNPGSVPLDDRNLKTVSEILDHWDFIRNSKISTELARISNSPFDFSIQSCEKVDAIKINNEIVHYIKCTVALADSSNIGRTYEALIGTPEIVENLAFLIEDRLVAKLKEIAPAAHAFPYHSIEILAKYLVPNINKDELIRCMIVALQTIDPPGVLLQMLQELKKCEENGELKERFIMESFSIQFRINELFINEFFDRIATDFPHDEPIGLGLKEFAKKLRKNLEARKQNPFFEFDIINAENIDTSTLNEALNKYGCCYLLQECEGEVDSIGRDKLCEFSQSQQDTNWQVFYAALKFIMLHIKNHKFLPLEEIVPSLSNMCPFYTVCSQSLRSEDGLICKTKPWEAEKWYSEKEGSCWYATAVRQTRPDPKEFT